MIENVFGWIIIQLILHPKASFVIMLVGFAVYCWTIDFIGYHLIRKRAVSEAVECPNCAKRTKVPVRVQNAPERLKTSQGAYVNE